MSANRSETTVARTTRETEVEVVLGGEGLTIDLPVPLFAHFLTAFFTTWGIGARVTARGDVAVDPHHLIEDVGLVLGQAVRARWAGYRGIERYGWALVPMDDARTEVALDLSGRPGCWIEQMPVGRMGDLEGDEVLPEFWQGLARSGGLTLHLVFQAGQNRHHRWESAFKAAGLAFRRATTARGQNALSTKGVIG
jgi:imidazoleglycerol-phosphate dehydratase